MINDNKYFVFGSNLKGIHGYGSALYAKKCFGAIEDIYEGISGNSYAIPTKYTPSTPLPFDNFKRHIKCFLEFAQNNPDKTFYLSKVGSNISDFNERDIAYEFLVDGRRLENIVYPGLWNNKYYLITNKPRITIICDNGCYNEDDLYLKMDEVLDLIIENENIYLNSITLTSNPLDKNHTHYEYYSMLENLNIHEFNGIISDKMSLNESRFLEIAYSTHMVIIGDGFERIHKLAKSEGLSVYTVSK